MFLEGELNCYRNLCQSLIPDAMVCRHNRAEVPYMEAFICMQKSYMYVKSGRNVDKIYFIQILSVTCNQIKCGFHWSTFEWSTTMFSARNHPFCGHSKEVSKVWPFGYLTASFHCKPKVWVFDYKSTYWPWKLAIFTVSMQYLYIFLSKILWNKTWKCHHMRLFHVALGRQAVGTRKALFNE